MKTKDIMGKPTTKEQWDQYEIDLQKHRDYMDAIRPMEYDFETMNDYKVAISQWDMKLHCDAPNKPGYLFANND